MACPKKLLFADELSEEHPFRDQLTPACECST